MSKADDPKTDRPTAEPESANKGSGERENEGTDGRPESEEVGGPKGLEPTRYGDWERKGRCIDF